MENILGGTIQMFLVTLLSFGLFFFNIPYWTGKEIGEVANNGVYRLGYMWFSKVGWWIYCGIERMNNLIDSLLHIKPESRTHVVINLLMYTVAVFAICGIYDYSMSAVAGGEVGELRVGEQGAFSKLSDLLLYWHIINNFAEVTSIGTFFGAIKASFASIVAFIVGTMFFFSVLYGLLAQKTLELRLVERFSKRGALVEIMDYEPETPSMATLPKQIGASIVTFFNQISILRNFRIFNAQITICVILLGYSLLKTISGEQADIQSLVLDLVDEMGIISVVVSFVISFVGAKIAVLFGRVAYRVLPAGVQSRLHNASVRGNEAVATMKRKRDEWSARFDVIFVRTQGAGWKGTADDVHHMNLK